jgi:hypothetical protein
MIAIHNDLPRDAQLRLFEQLLGNCAMLGEAGCYLTTFLASLGCIQKASRYLHSRAQTDPLWLPRPT